MENNTILTKLPIWEEGTYKGKVNRKAMVGMDIELLYKNKIYVVKIIDYIAGSNPRFIVDYNGYIKKNGISCADFITGGYYGGILNLFTSEFKYNIGDNICDNKRNINIIDREYKPSSLKNCKIIKWYKYKCNVCGYTGVMNEINLSSGNGCGCCAGQVVVPHINSIWTREPWMIELGVSEEDAKSNLPQSNKKVEVICPNCGKKKKITLSNIYKRKTISCTCGDGLSYISKYIMSILDQLKTNYNTEVKYEWNKYINPKNNKLTQASVDFVIYKDGREIPLEADGGFHRKDNNMRGTTAEMQQHIDKQRDENCLKYLGEETIRISDEGDIKENVLGSMLNDLFDLSQIDWLKCEEFALKNIVKEICNYWNSKEEWETTRDVGNKFKLDKTSIISYLKKGTKLGWTNYDPKEEMRKSASRNRGFRYESR